MAQWIAAVVSWVAMAVAIRSAVQARAYRIRSEEARDRAVAARAELARRR